MFCLLEGNVVIMAGYDWSVMTMLVVSQDAWAVVDETWLLVHNYWLMLMVRTPCGLFLIWINVACQQPPLRNGLSNANHIWEGTNRITVAIIHPIPTRLPYLTPSSGMALRTPAPSRS